MKVEFAVIVFDVAIVGRFSTYLRCFLKTMMGARSSLNILQALNEATVKLRYTELLF